MFKYISFNWISFIFIGSVLLKFFSTNIVFSFFLASCFGIALIGARKYNLTKAVILFMNNKSLFVAFMISFLSTFYYACVVGTIKTSYVFEVLLYGLTTLWGIFIYKEKGTEYIEKGFLHIFILFAIISVTGIYEYFTNDNIFVKFAKMETTFLMNGNKRIGACFLHPIPYANILLVAVMTFFFLLKKNNIYILGVILILLNVLFAQSRSSWFALAFLYISYIIAVEKTKIYKLLKNGMILLLVSIIMFQVGLLDVVLSRFEGFSDNYLNNDYQRTGTMLLFMNEMEKFNILEILFGKGNHASAYFMLKHELQWSEFRTTDNLYVADVYNNGVIYLCVIIYMTILSIRKYVQLKLSKFERFSWGTNIGFLIVFFFYEPFVNFCVLYIFFMNLGFIMCFLQEEKTYH